MSNVIIISGISGSGKTTFAETLAIGRDATICTADDYFMVNGEYQFDFRKLSDAHQFCQEKFQKALDEKREWVIVNNTNTSQKAVDPYLEMAKNAGYMVHWIFMAPHHGHSNVHGVPPEAIERQTQQVVSLYGVIHGR